MKRLIFDIETNGLLDVVDRVHCLVIQDVGTGKVFRFNSQKRNIEDGVAMLKDADQIIGHNILKYDIPVLKKLYGFKHDNWLDTLLLSRLIYSNIADNDFDFNRKNRVNPLPGKLIGTHGLKSWGYRLNFYKGTYAEDTENCWDKWSEEMEDYCEQDVRLNTKLYNKLMQKHPTEESVRLEHEFAAVIWRQEQRGFRFDTKAAQEFYAELIGKREVLIDKLREVFKPWSIPVKRFRPKRPNKRYGYVACKEWPDLIDGKQPSIWVGECTKIKVIEFNPGSTLQIAGRLMKLRGWKPKAYTDKGQVKVDEDVLKHLPYPEVPLLTEYLMLNKRIGQIAEGKNGWLKLEKDGRIYGSVTTNGAVTGRCTHQRPNVAQTPACGSPYGHECRSLFQPSEGMVLVGCDASGLELRCLAHYMGRYDHGKYADIILNGDIHTANQEAAGLPSRDTAKTFIYGFLYGAGDAKIGRIVDGSVKQGAMLRRKFLTRLPALNRLLKAVQKVASRKYLIGLDGRHLPIRSKHAALNTLLQSAGALAMKQALIFLDRRLQELGLVPGKDYEFVANVHDEFQIECRPDCAEQIGEEAAQSIRDAGNYFKFRCPLDGEYKIGSSWAETH